MSIIKENSRKLTSWTKRSAALEGSVIQACNQPQEPNGDLIQDIYRDHLNHRQIIVNGPIDELTTELVTLQIMKFNEEDDELEMHKGYDRMANPITLKIISPGGYVDQGMAVVSAIEQSSTPVIGAAIGNCASMAGIILMACHARLISKYSKVMIHSIHGGWIDKVFGMKDYVEDMVKDQQMIDDLIIARTAITQAQLTKVHESRKDWWLTSTEAKELGVVDDLLPAGIPIANYKDRKKVKAAPAKKR